MEIWFDLDNSPHVPLFRPVFAELQNQKMDFVITARDFAQTQALLDFWNIPHVMIGRHGGKNKFAKVLNLFQRSRELINYIEKRKISLAVSHGSRTQLIAAYRKNIPSILMLDYEYTESKIFNTFANYLLIPAVIPDERLKKAGFNLKKVIRYNGFKEEIYLKDFSPDTAFRKSINIQDDKILVTIRPPSIVGNYHNNISEQLFRAVLDHLSSFTNVHCLVLNRTSKEQELIPKEMLSRSNITILKHPVDGLQLIWNSDLVISGGGTMNRESALLGVPTYSIFTGQRPFLDEYLQDQKKLKFIESISEARSIPVKKRVINKFYNSANTSLVNDIIDTFKNIITKR